MSLKQNPSPFSQINDELLTQFCQFLSDSIGLYFPKERRDEVSRKIEPIQRAFGFEDPTSCLRWIMQKPLTEEKIAVLARHLTIGETYFFRDPDNFHALETKILPEIIQKRKNAPHIRIWCAACCTGEEPYSIAILLHRVLPNWREWNISILGTDINPHFLRIAEEGRFKEWSFRGVPASIKSHYFYLDSQQRYCLIPDIKKMVKFSYLNLIEDVYPSLIQGTNAMDVIFCNNVLIYFSAQNIERVTQKLASSLTEEGYLFVTAIESSSIQEPRLQFIRFPRASIFKKTSPPPPSFAPGPYPVPLLEKKRMAPLPSLKPFDLQEKKEERKPREEDLYASALQLYQKGFYRETLSLLERRFPLYKNNSVPFMKEIILLTRVLANLGQIEEAQTWCEIALQADKVDPVIHFLYAMILQERGKISESAQSLKRALFLHPQFIIAHFYLGNLWLSLHKKEEALRCFRNALQLLKKEKETDVVPHSDGMTVQELTQMILHIQKQNA